MSKQNLLATVLNKIIDTYEDKISELIKNNNSILLTNKGIIDDLKNDINVLTNFNLDIVKNVLIETNTSEEEQAKIYNYLETIQKILTLNQEFNTTYTISDEQLSYLELFFNKITELEEINKNKHLNNLKKITKFTTTISKYKSLIKQIEDDNNNHYIADINLIKLLLSEPYLEDRAKQDILLDIINHNKIIHQKIVSN